MRFARLAARPMCAQCKAPVDEFFEGYDPHLGKVRYVARCHDESEIVDLSEAEASGLHFGTAFRRPPALPARGETETERPTTDRRAKT